MTVSKETLERWYYVSQIFQLPVSAVIAAAAIFGPFFFRWLETPNIVLSINDPKGHLEAGGTTFWYYLRVKNRKRNTVARKVGVYCVALEKEQIDGSFKIQPIPRVRLSWPFERNMTHLEEYSKMERNIGTEDLCNLCALYSAPGLQLALTAGGTQVLSDITQRTKVRLHLKVIADNFESKQAFVIEISWDGQFSLDAEELSQHLVVREILV